MRPIGILGFRLPISVKPFIFAEKTFFPQTRIGFLVRSWLDREVWLPPSVSKLECRL